MTSQTMDAAAPADDDASKYPSAALAWWGLIILVIGYFMYFVDRNILTLLVAPVRKDLNINDTQMGILNGYSFSVLNGLMAVPFAWYCDRFNRKAVLVFGLALWGASTVLSGFTTSFEQLVLTRMGLGIGEAALMPAAFSLISDYFPKSARGKAVGVLGIGGFGGIGLSYIIGGAVLSLFRGVDTVNYPMVGQTTVWHAGFITVGLITICLAILAITVHEPPRLAGAPQQRAEVAGESFFKYLGRHWAAFTLVMGGYICLGILAIGWFAWLPTYFIRVFKMAPIDVGAQVGWTTTIAGVSGAVVGGYVADWLARNNARGGKILTLFMMFCAWVFCAIGIYYSNSKELSLVIVFVFTFADGIGFMQYGNVLQEMFPASMRARSIAAWNVTSSMLTYGAGPFMFGYASTNWFTAETGLRDALGLLSLPLIVIGLASSWFSRRPYDRARKAADAGATTPAW